MILRASDKLNRKLWRVFVNGHEVHNVVACRVGLRGWVDQAIEKPNKLLKLTVFGDALAIKRIRNVIVNVVPIKKGRRR